MKRSARQLLISSLGVAILVLFVPAWPLQAQLAPQCPTPPTAIWVNRIWYRQPGEAQYVLVAMEDYVSSVLEGEMGPIGSIPLWDDQALQAAAVTIRTWSSYWCHKHEFTGTPYGTVYGLYDTSEPEYYDQEYNPGHSGDTARYNQQVAATQGIYATYGGVLIDAQYRARNGDPTNPLENLFTRSAYPYLRSVSDPVAAAESRSQGDSQSVGLPQNGSHYWASGHDPTADNRLHPRWSGYQQILSHYYTDIHLKNANSDQITPSYRWVPLSVDWYTSNNRVPVMYHGQSYSVTFQVQNTGTTTWSDPTWVYLSYHGWEHVGLQTRKSAGILQAVAPGDTTVQTLTLSPPIPSRPGTPYHLRFEMFIDPDGWFSEVESGRTWPTYDVCVCVDGPCGCTILLPLMLDGG